MSETKFGVLASLLYMLAFLIVAAGVIFSISGNNSGIRAMRVDASPYIAGALASLFWGFVFHAFHTSTLRRDALLAEIRDLLAVRRNAAPPKPSPMNAGERSEAWEVGQRDKH